MNENPWRVDEIARLQRERIHEDMHQIRLEEKAERVRPRRLDLLARLIGWLERLLEVRREIAAPTTAVRRTHRLRGDRAAGSLPR